MVEWIKFIRFAVAKQNRGVAQLVACYVRDVEVGRSSRLTPTEKSFKLIRLKAFLAYWNIWTHVRLRITMDQCKYPVEMLYVPEHTDMTYHVLGARRIRCEGIKGGFYPYVRTWCIMSSAQMNRRRKIFEIQNGNSRRGNESPPCGIHGMDTVDMIHHVRTSG